MAAVKSIWYELLKAAKGEPIHEAVVCESLDFIAARNDCSDFVLHGILRMLYQFDPGREALGTWGHHGTPTQVPSQQLLRHAKQVVINFKYFPDEPGVDSMCTWTENHYILFTSAAFLAGQLYPDERFSNSSETGTEKSSRSRTRILRWMEMRFRTGFSEWLSNVYYDEDLTALLSLLDFAEDDEIRRKAEMLIDLLLLDMVLNSFQGVFGSTHGRVYEDSKKWAAKEAARDTLKLLFDLGEYSHHDNMAAAAFSLSRYSAPPVLTDIARGSSGEFDQPLENRQRMGIRLDEMQKWGIRPDNFEDGMLYLTLEAYLHPRTIANTLRMFDTCSWWDNSILSAFKPYRRILTILNSLGGLPVLARILKRDLCRNTREEVNIYTYKTADYMLSTAQDYRKGYGGDQQHIWQATLGPDAVCFTTHPARLEGATPNYWTGSGLLPRAAQYRNVTLCIYKIERIPALYVPTRHFFTHAWLPKDQFDETFEKDGWIFARKEQGYLALRSKLPYYWNTEGSTPTAIQTRKNPEDFDREVIAPGARNIWICQMGRASDDGPFEQFIQTICAAELIFSGLDVAYHSPGNGWIRFGWQAPLTVDEQEIDLHGYPRYDNPYVQAPFDPAKIHLATANNTLTLNWKTGERQVECL